MQGCSIAVLILQCPCRAVSALASTHQAELLEEAGMAVLSSTPGLNGAGLLHVLQQVTCVSGIRVWGGLPVRQQVTQTSRLRV